MNELMLPKNVFAKPVIEYRSMPTLIEQRNNLITEMTNLIKKAKEETRALDDKEQERFNQVKADVTSIDATIKAQEDAEALANQQMANNVNPNTSNPQQEEQRALAEASLVKFLRGEERALDVSGNGGIIPTIIASKIIAKIRELSPIYARATIYNVGGNLVFPKFDYTQITTSYIADMTALTPANGNFTTVTLNNFIAGALVQISRSLMNRSDFNLVDFIVNQMAMSIANFLENQLLNGVGTTAATGIFVDASAISVTAASATALVLDDLINTQMAIPVQYWNDSVWIMNKTVFTYLRKLKDTTGVPLLQRDINNDIQWSMLGSPVYVSENAPNTMTTGLKILAYGDMSGLYVKLAQNVEISVLNELYATSHAVGVVGYVELDSKIVEAQKIAVLKMA
jgi:HK97 family phage major capsid protein